MSESRELTVDVAIEEYKNAMNPADKAAYEIAVKQLESSFDIEKSIGFMDYLMEQNIEIVEG